MINFIKKMIRKLGYLCDYSGERSEDNELLQGKNLLTAVMYVKFLDVESGKILKYSLGHKAIQDDADLEKCFKKLMNANLRALKYIKASGHDPDVSAQKIRFVPKLAEKINVEDMKNLSFYQEGIYA